MAEIHRIVPYPSPEPSEMDMSPIAKPDCNDGGNTSTTVMLPDLFVSIMSPSPRLNPVYELVRPAANEWTQKLLNLDAKAYAKHQRVNFSRLASMWMPEADEEGLRVMVDWLTWVFYFDDSRQVFDDGELRDNPAAAQAEAEATLSLMSDSDQQVSPELHPLRYMFHSTWIRFRNRSSKALQNRYKKCMEEYINGILQQVDVSSFDASLDADLYLHFRRKSVGLRPCHALLEYACGIQIPDHVMAHPAIQECMAVSIDLVLLQNDILSYKKEQASNVIHNLIHIYRNQGMTAQEAFDQAGNLIVRAIRRWHLAQLDLPIWGEKIDKEVQRYLQGCLDSCVGSLNWSPHLYFLGDLNFDEVNGTKLLLIGRYYPHFSSGLG
ncbi:hypothetical protein MGG_03833 [Pyricularia oryzae 70-15]|uniref:Terpene synthase n=3 Tax=Pyricularia oryzae TaxID=318829 RepID=G4NHI2_PYRO7|nr:uncharacterized protein MGG_03833 [Pyricularia oryzae 70-15]EHA47692.1 hypothetical protein MGG_03833 [Pyricularia oryzae 70-15]ELQ44499.1 hypothetical protein OOU_Y34scaffold00085g15 [Pyricularia oryzae Y34]